MNRTTILPALVLIGLGLPQRAERVAISDIRVTANRIPVYEKYEVRFNVDTSALYPLFSFDPKPPPGVPAVTGITVEARITTPSGTVHTQPGFYMTEADIVAVSGETTWVESTRSYWAVRYAPREAGVHTVTLSATDRTGTSTASAGAFTATPPRSPGFVGVSGADPRYFQFSNGDLFWPVGPAWVGREGWTFARYKDKGHFIDRRWLGGSGMYSANWARWKSSAEQGGNEGFASRLTFFNDPAERPPGGDGLAQALFYPEGWRMWLTRWPDDASFTALKPRTRYAGRLVYRLQDIAGPRVAGPPHGFVIRSKEYWWPDSDTPDSSDAELRSGFTLFSHVTTTDGWEARDFEFTTDDAPGSSLFLYLDNVTAGQAYVSLFSLKECLDARCTRLGGEVIRNPSADLHTYVEQRPAAMYDAIVEEARQNGVYLTLVVHDKNDWVPNHLAVDGRWTEYPGDGYYQPENTKARWLLRQWYRYVSARWGYATSVFAFEMNNEGPPNSDGVNAAGRPTAAHWESAEAFGRHMRDLNENGRLDDEAHPHLTSTSFWCCWRPEFWGNNHDFGHMSYGDLHQYTDYFDSSTGSAPLPYDDTASFLLAMARRMAADRIGKPMLLGEVGLSQVDGSSAPLPLTADQVAVAYHNMIWAAVDASALFPVGYWFSEHLDQIDWPAIARPQHLFMQTLDLNRGGYVDAAPRSSNAALRAIGQKHVDRDRAHLWIQNTGHTYTSLNAPAQSGTIAVTLRPNADYVVERWDTGRGVVVSTETARADGAGQLALAVSGLRTDLAVRIYLK